MNLKSAIKLHMSSYGLGPGSISVSTPKLREVEADASPSDLASHHVWQEPSSTDTTIRNWQQQRAIEKSKGRTMDPFETMAIFRMMGSIKNMIGKA